MNITEKTDEEILAIASPLWDHLVTHSNAGEYGEFVKDFSQSLVMGLNQVEVGKQFARSELTRSLADDPEFLGTIRRGEHVTILYRQKSTKKPGEWLGRLVLGYEQDKIKIFGASIF